GKSAPIGAGIGASAEPDDNHASGWKVPLLTTVASEAEGVDELLRSLLQHRDYLQRTGGIDRRQRKRMRAIVESRLRNRLYTRFLQQVPQRRLDTLLRAIVARETDPYSAAESLLQELD
ncbi:MAG: hypothetical protein QF376_04545, partial [Anaerolineales bacterium]|nr:hypothetical protein [Anaerolineales bacterium]